MNGYLTTRCFRHIRLFVKSYNVTARCLSNAAAPNNKFKVSFHENVGIINFGDGENRITYDLLESYHSALDTVESNSSCNGLVSTAEGKFFSNGVDQDFVLHHKDDADYAKQCMADMRNLLQRILTFPLPTVAALNGHTFGVGAILSLNHDFRVMRKDRGWICWNEIFANVQFTHFSIELLRNKLPVGQVRNQAIVLGRRFTASEAKESGIVELITDQSTLVSESVNLIKTIVKDKNYDRKSMNVMKSDLYYNVLKASNDYVNPNCRF